MDIVITALIALAVGIIIGYLLAISRASSKLAELKAQHKADTEKISWVEGAEKHLREAFEALASNALKGNSEDFANRTRDQLLQPLEKSLKELDGQVRNMEEKREGAYKSLDQHLGHLRDAYEKLRDTTSGLTTALTSSSTTRGQWGEVQLRRIVEMSGMTSHVDFDEQERGEAGQPDMVIHMPNEGSLPVDAKTPIKSYLEAMDATDDSTRKRKLVAHAGAVKTRIRELASKGYWKQFENAPDVVVMFVPNEASLGGAFEADRTLFEYALDQRVLIASPVTLLALLKTAAYAWQQQSMAHNAKEIAQHARELSGRLSTFITHLQKSGKGLDSAVKSYNDAVGSLQSRVLPSVRRFNELGVSDDAPEIKQIDRQATLPGGGE